MGTMMQSIDHYRCQSSTRLTCRFRLTEPLRQVPPCIPVITTLQLHDPYGQLLQEFTPRANMKESETANLGNHCFKLPKDFQSGLVAFTTLMVLSHPQPDEIQVLDYLKSCQFKYVFLGLKGKATVFTKPCRISVKLNASLVEITKQVLISGGHINLQLPC